MKKLYLLLILPVIIVSCSREEDYSAGPQANQGVVLVERPNSESVPQLPALTREAIDAKINQFMIERSDFRWQWMNLHQNWSAISHAGEFAIGYKPVHVKNVNEIIHTIDVQKGEWRAVHDALIKLVLDELNRNAENEIKAEDIIVEDDTDLPIIVFRLSNKEVITKLYNLENVRYLEPMGYWPQMTENKSTSGCNASTEPLNTNDWTNILPASLLPWNFNSVNIPDAWATAQGQGIKIGLIDAGISASQTLLGNQFKDGYSNVNNRSVTAAYTFGSSSYTSCTHGTSMSGLAAGPRNAQNATTGVAYKSSLYFVRGCEDVVLDLSSELSGVKNALVKLGKDKHTKIISMSIGTPFYSSVLYDGVSFAYNKGKMMFAAAGTSFGWTSWWGVIYPAAFSQCITVTGVKENGAKCSSCHDGSQVEFTIPMERDVNDSRNSLSLALSGYAPTYIGGSSCATAITAGIAAVVWSVKPSLSRTQIYTAMCNTAQFYPSKNSTKGWGNVNAAAAVAMAAGM